MPLPNHCINCDKPINGESCSDCDERDILLGKLYDASLKLTRDKKKKRFNLEAYKQSMEVDIFYSNIWDELITVFVGCKKVMSFRNKTPEIDLVVGDWLYKILNKAGMA